MNAELLKETIKRELPALLREDPALRAYILELTRQEYAKPGGNARPILRNIVGVARRDREEQTRKWEEQNRKWDEQNRRWNESTQEQNSKWEEQNRKWEKQNRKWDTHQAKSQEEFQRVHEEIMAQAKKFDRSIGAVGSRWGVQSEAAFRNALAGILKENFDVQVLNVSEYDDEGVVFGRPDQVELDVIIKNGLLLICELKSSIDKAGMYSFERKARFYEQRHARKAQRLIVISPMIDTRAQKVAKQLGIETYSDSLDVEEL